MVPNKLLRVLGYNNLSIILMQERRHWLLKTSKNKQIQDSVTGDIYQGRVDNAGADVVIESKKLPYKYDFTSNIKFSLTHADEILDIKLSALPHSACVNGLMYARIISINYQYNDDPKLYSSYKIKFTNASECLIPFGASPSSDEVYAGKWIKTTTAPTLLVYDNTTHDYTIERPLTFTGATNPVWYYPLEESLQPFEVTKSGTTYTLAAATNNNSIGDPLFWFTCDESNIGSNVEFTNNIGSNNTQIMYISNAGNATPYNALIFVGVDGHDDATPSGGSINGFSIQVSPAAGRTFTNSELDFNVPLNNVVTFKNAGTSQTYTMALTFGANDELTMNNASNEWTYIDDATYEIPMAYFAVNCYSSDLDTPLVPLFDMTFDNSVPFVQSTKDYGYAGMRFYAGNPNNDTTDRYPYNLNNWEGLPAWLTDPVADVVQEHGVVYAMHNTPTSDPQIPESSQGAGLIFDPGLIPTPGQDEEPKGRVYILSNDDLNYHNNKTYEFPKPDRTAARICDIPTNAVQLSGARGLASTQVVDKKYTRTETSYTVTDKGKIYNELPSRWVKPTAYNIDDIPVYIAMGLTNKYVFESVEELLAVKMDSRHNEFRFYENLNPLVDVTEVDVNTITHGGSGYEVDDEGLCIVGGSSFTYTITSVGIGGIAASIAVTPDEHVTHIPLCNFDMVSDTSYITQDYGTSPLTGQGSGLKFRFQIDQEYLESIRTRKGELYTDLYALVRDGDGLFIFTYEIDQSSQTTPKLGTWVKGDQISEFETTQTNMSYDNYGVETAESFVNSVLPKIETLPVTKKLAHDDLTSLQVMQTASCVNIIDTAHTPVVPILTENSETPDNVVDLCKFYCDGIMRTRLINGALRNADGVMRTLKAYGFIRFDSYVIWRWRGTSPTDIWFDFGIVYRGFSNLFSTDSTTKLPRNKLNSDKFVHFNAGTTVVWNVPEVGPMVWMYDPTYTKKENYRIDPQTMELEVSREELTYADIDVRMGEDQQIINIVDENGNYLWNVLTNNPQNVPTTPSIEDPIYIDPELTEMSDVTVGLNIHDTSPEHKMKGNWKLVFPRVDTFTFVNDVSHTQYNAKKLQTIKSRGIPAPTDAVYDQNGNNVSAKTLIISENPDPLDPSANPGVYIYDTESGEWKDI